MKGKLLAMGILLLLIISPLITSLQAKPNQNKTNDGPKPGIDFNGPHYNLNLIGKRKEMPGDKDNPSRHTMFVPLDTSGFYIDLNTPNNLGEETLDGIKISITQGSEFAMIDGDATDGYGAFQLGPGKYYCYIAVKAKSPKYPDAYTDITGWVEAYDNTGALWYYIDVGYVQVKKGKNSWTDATDLFFVNTNEDDFGFLTGLEADYIDKLGMWVFDYMSGLDTWYEDSGETAPYDLSDLAYFWQLVNSGNKLIQVRFYPMN
jgi:hypothetical protein